MANTEENAPEKRRRRRGPSEEEQEKERRERLQYDVERSAANLKKRVEMYPPMHPLARLLPRMSTAEFNMLMSSIEKEGLLEPIVLYEDMVLDGRNRQEACVRLKVEPQFVNLPEGKDPLAYVIDRNLARRHLTAGQRAFIGERLATNEHGGNRREDDPFDDQLANLRLDDAAKLVGVSERSISTARAMIEAEAWNLIEEVETGKLSLNAAATKFRVPMPVAKRVKGETKSGEEKYNDDVQNMFDVATKDTSALAGFRKVLVRFHKRDRGKSTEGFNLLLTYLTRRIYQLERAKATVTEFSTTGFTRKIE